ncbi:MAG: 50S ribosomal protein L10 [Coriobacteriales bacterium]|nr:50S ribosomal protein L10 [Coriobacteriales bacterium]
MPTQEKIDQVAQIEECFKNANACWLIDARGLSVQQSQTLRRNIREAEGHMHIFKNNLAAIAIKNLELPNMDELLVGPTAFVYADGDVAAPAKAIKDFAKENEALEIKGGFMDGEVLDADAVKKIADLPSKEVLIGMLLGVMQGPLVGLARCCAGPMEATARAIQAIADKA